MRMSGNAIDILGGHEDAIHFNPAQHVLSNADYANTADEIVAVMREQHKEGSDFAKIYETGPDRMVPAGSAPCLGDPVCAQMDLGEEPGDPAFWEFHTPFQYTEAQLEAAVAEAARLGTNVGVHCQGEPGARFAASAGRGIHRSRHPAQRRDHAPDAREGHLRCADLHHLRVFCDAPRFAGASSD